MTERYSTVAPNDPCGAFTRFSSDYLCMTSFTTAEREGNG